MRLVSGTRIGNYEVLTPQGAGGMGEVYRARDTRLDRTVAIKSLHRAERLLHHRFILDFLPWIVRLDPDLHALLDREPFVPRRASVSLVWPLEAPMIDAARHALFKEVRIESGMPQGSGGQLS